jgi:hypothetical protein
MTGPKAYRVVENLQADDTSNIPTFPTSIQTIFVAVDFLRVRRSSVFSSQLIKPALMYYLASGWTAPSFQQLTWFACSVKLLRFCHE